MQKESFSERIYIKVKLFPFFILAFTTTIPIIINFSVCIEIRATEIFNCPYSNENKTVTS